MSVEESKISPEAHEVRANINVYYYIYDLTLATVASFLCVTCVSRASCQIF